MSEIINPNEAEPQKKPYDFNSGELKEKVDALRKSLNLPTEEKKEELSPEAQEVRTQAEKEETVENPEILGKDVDWTLYELPEGYAHFYPKAKFKATEKGYQWVTELTEFFSITKQYDAKGLSKRGDALGLGDYLTSTVNGPDGWRIVGVYPSGSGSAGILFQRVVSIVLPDPKLIETETVTPPPTDEELKKTEDAALAWVGKDKKDESEPVQS